MDRRSAPMLIRRRDGSATAMGAYIDMAERKGCEIVTPLFAMANPSGPVEAAAYRVMCDAIVEAIAAGCDAIMLDLHGAMVVEDNGDGEGALLERIRAIAPATPLALALDLHGNISPRMIGHADIVVGFKTYPHIDMYRYRRARGAAALRYARGKDAAGRRGCAARGLSQTLCQNTEIPGAMRDGVEFARGLERHGALAATVFGGFYLADIEMPA